jgi:hypothetical protein
LNSKKLVFFRRLPRPATAQASPSQAEATMKEAILGIGAPSSSSGGGGASSSSGGSGSATSSSFKSFFGGGNNDSQPQSTASALGAKLSTAASQVANGELPTFTEESAFTKCCPNLTYTQVCRQGLAARGTRSRHLWFLTRASFPFCLQRIIGFVGCCVSGWVLSLVGSLTLIGGPTPKNITTFAILYVTGNVVALLGTGFLLGPKTQCRKMWDPTRRFSAAFYLSMLVVVFALAVSGQNVGLVIAMLIVQVCAASWYALSYIPFGRKMVIAFFRRTLCKPCCDAADAVKASRAGGSSGGGGAMAQI